MSETVTRREALKLGAAAGVLAGAARRAAAATGPKPIRFGFIGVGGRGTGLLQQALAHEGVEVTAICDIDEAHLNRGIDLVRKARGNEPAGHSAGPTDYRRLLTRDDVDAVLIATPMQLHGRMAADSLRAGKHVLSEVAAAVTVDECLDLVRAQKESGRTYMLAENVCYYRANLIVLNMIEQGLFGELTYAECGYVHDCRSLLFNGDGSLTWRGELARQESGNWYPTHSLGPVAQWLGINRGDRLVSLVSRSSPAVGVKDYATKRFGADHPTTKLPWRGDSNTSLLSTERGRVIELRFDTSSARPHPTTTYFTLQGATASYHDREAVPSIWVDGKSKEVAWQSINDYAAEYEHPLWKQWAEQAAKTGHGGADFFVMLEFLETLRTGRPSPIDAVDAAAWSCVIPLSAKSVREGGAPQEIPDFGRA